MTTRAPFHAPTPEERIAAREADHLSQSRRSRSRDHKAVVAARHAADRRRDRLEQLNDAKAARRSFRAFERSMLRDFHVWKPFRLRLEHRIPARRGAKKKQERRGWKALPSIGFDVIDSKGRRGIFLSIQYDGAKSTGRGVFRRRIEYGLNSRDVVLTPDSRAMLISNVAKDPDEAVALADEIEAFARAERLNAKVCLNLVIGYPRAAGARERELILRRFCQRSFADEGLPFMAVNHEPKRASKVHNPHGHVTASLRPVHREGPYRYLISKNLRVDLDGEEGMARLRRILAEVTTQVMHEAGFDHEYTHLSNAARGIAVIPQEGLSKEQSEAAQRGEIVAANERNRALAQQMRAKILQKNKAPISLPGASVIALSPRLARAPSIVSSALQAASLKRARTFLGLRPRGDFVRIQLPRTTSVSLVPKAPEPSATTALKSATTGPKERARAPILFPSPKPATAIAEAVKSVPQVDSSQRVGHLINPRPRSDLTRLRPLQAAQSAVRAGSLSVSPRAMPVALKALASRPRVAPLCTLPPTAESVPLLKPKRTIPLASVIRLKASASVISEPDQRRDRGHIALPQAPSRSTGQAPQFPQMSAPQARSVAALHPRQTLVRAATISSLRGLTGSATALVKSVRTSPSTARFVALRSSLRPTKIAASAQPVPAARAAKLIARHPEPRPARSPKAAFAPQLKPTFARSPQLVRAAIFNPANSIVQAAPVIKVLPAQMAMPPSPSKRTLVLARLPIAPRAAVKAMPVRPGQGIRQTALAIQVQPRAPVRVGQARPLPKALSALPRFTSVKLSFKAPRLPVQGPPKLAATPLVLPKSRLQAARLPRISPPPSARKASSLDVAPRSFVDEFDRLRAKIAAVQAELAARPLLEPRRTSVAKEKVAEPQKQTPKPAGSILSPADELCRAFFRARIEEERRGAAVEIRKNKVALDAMNRSAHPGWVAEQKRFRDQQAAAARSPQWGR